MENIKSSFYLTSLRAELMSLLGGESHRLLNATSTCYKEKEYKVIRYNKSLLCFDIIPTYGLCRSLVFDQNNKLLCFAPPKSIQMDNFIQSYQERKPQIMAEEFVEGTMINVFWNETDWEMTTRSIIGAETTFFDSSKTFRTLFLEACLECNLEFSALNKDYCYSFVLQHPESRIVTPILKPDLYLIAVYKIEQNDEQLVVHQLECSSILPCIKTPKTFDFSSYGELINTYGNQSEYHVVGVMLVNKETGERAKIRNPAYEHVRQLRGNQPKLQYHYLCLRKDGKVSEYLKYYPEHKSAFTLFRTQVHLYTNTLFIYYVDCFIKRMKPLKEYPSQFKTQMYHIHQHYLSELREKKQHVTHSVVVNIVNTMHPTLLMHSINKSE